MSNWLEEVRPPKYLRYFFYIAYSWYRPYKSERSEAHYTSIIILGVSKGLLLLIFLNIFYTNQLYGNANENGVIFLICFVIFLFFYFFFLYKKKWKSHIDEFNHLNRKDRRRGTLYLFLYFFIILLILLPLSFYFVIKNSPHYT